MLQRMHCFTVDVKHRDVQNGIVEHEVPSEKNNTLHISLRRKDGGKHMFRVYDYETYGNRFVKLSARDTDESITNHAALIYIVGSSATLDLVDRGGNSRELSTADDFDKLVLLRGNDIIHVKAPTDLNDLDLQPFCLALRGTDVEIFDVNMLTQADVIEDLNLQ